MEGAEDTETRGDLRVVLNGHTEPRLPVKHLMAFLHHLRDLRVLLFNCFPVFSAREACSVFHGGSVAKTLFQRIAVSSKVPGAGLPSGQRRFSHRCTRIHTD